VSSPFRNLRVLFVIIRLRVLVPRNVECIKKNGLCTIFKLASIPREYS
jgi:hypothetical protein